MAEKEMRENPSVEVASSQRTPPEYSTEGDAINSSGHVQELQRNFSLISLAGIGLTVGNVWPAIGGSIVVALFNGGPPGTLIMQPRYL
jgi:hypothetical protein